MNTLMIAKKSHFLKKPTLSAYTSPVLEPCTSPRVHEAASFRWQASVQTWSSGPSNALEWTGKVDSCSPQPLFHTGKPTNSVFCFPILFKIQASLPLTTTTHTHTHTHTRNLLLDTHSTMSSLPSPQTHPTPPPFQVKFGTGYTL